MKLLPPLWSSLLAILLVLGGGVANAATLSDGLVAFYPLDGSGEDASGNGFDLVPSNLVYSTNRHGRPSAACAFEVGAFGGLPQALLQRLSGRGAMTVAFWIKISRADFPGPASLNAFAFGTPSAGRMLTLGVLLQSPEGPLRVQYSHYYRDEVLSSDPVPDGVWTHIAASISEGNEISLYIDGKPSGRGQADHDFGDQLGWVGRGPEVPWKGLMDEFRIYERDLDDFEMASLYALEREFSTLPEILKPGTAKAVAQTSNGFVVGVVLQSGGRGYVTVPQVRIVGGGGNGATAVATIHDGVVTAVTITNPGQGYSSVPEVEIDPPPTVPRRASGIAQVVNGFVVGVSLLDEGAGYGVPPVVRIEGGNGVGALAEAEVRGGAVVAIRIVSPGAGYTSVPRVVIARPPTAPRLAVEVSRVKVTLGLVLGRRYILESSADLIQWTAVGAAFLAESEDVEQEFVVQDTGRFFRVNELP